MQRSNNGDDFGLLVGRGSDRAVADDDALVGKVHLGGEGGVGNPFVRGARGGLLEHLVDLLEGEALGLGDEEVGEGEREAAEGTPHEEDLGAEVGLALLGSDEVWSDDTDNLESLLVFCLFVLSDYVGC